MNPSVISLALFLAVVGFILAAVPIGLVRSGQNLAAALKVEAVLLVWLLALGVVVKSGVIKEEPMPRLMIFFGVSNLVGAIFAFSRWGTKLSRELPIEHLVVFQAFRFPLELVLHDWAQDGIIPATMTWTGKNVDILTGVLAAAAFALTRKSTKTIKVRTAWFFNVIGLGLLFNVMRVAILSSPLPFSWDVQPPLELAFYVPQYLIVPVCVAGALGGHIILTRALLNAFR